MASTSIQRSRTAGTTKTKFTISMWVKRADNAAKYLLVNYTDDANRALFQFGGSDELLFQQRVSNSLQVSLQTNRKFRDPNGWYAITLTGDSTLAASADRLKLFVNGVRETSFATDTQLSQDSNYYINEATTNGFRIGEKGDGSDYFNGLMSHVHFCDGYAYEASAFGETDATTGEWKINTSPSVTYGTNGFFLKMEDSSNMDLDSSSNALTFTTNGNLTATQDNPSNNFATWNPLVYNENSPIFKSGNTEEEGQSDGRYPNTISTLAMPKSGKFYAEFKKVDPSNDKEAIGIADTEKAIEAIRVNTAIYNTSYEGQVCVRQDGNYITYGSEAAYFGGGSFGDDDIFQIAFDGDNGAIYFGKNGTWGNSSDPTSGSSKTGAVDISSLAWYIAANDLVFLAGEISSGGYGHLQANFGNGYFGTTQVASAGTNASSNGIFEYDVPTGYTALSTKGLNL